MILQPILENATIHGLAPDGVSMLQVSFDQNGNRVICTIEDNGEGIETTRENAKRKNIQRQSKGLEILDQKISTMNRLYQIDAQLLTTDMRHDVPARRGTRTMFSFDYTKISKHELLTENQDEKN